MKLEHNSIAKRIWTQHPSNAEKMIFVRYVNPPSDVKNRAEYDAWMERVSYLCDDLHWLLQQPHTKFWCQVIFDESLHKALDSFLRLCPRSGDCFNSLPQAAKQKQNELCRLIFMVCLRMSTHKESKNDFITPAMFGEILYENFLFDIPKLFDLCSLYGRTNGELLQKMVNNIFTQQPKYLDDLRETVPTIIQVLINISVRCGIQLDNAQLSPQKLEESAAAKSLTTLTSDDLADVVLYLSDTADTLHRFLELYTPACHIFHQFSFCPILANFFDSVIPELVMAVKQHPFQSLDLRRTLIRKLHHTKKSLLTVIHIILNSVCLRPVIENSSDESIVTSCTEDFLHTMTSVLTERRFLAAYEGLFSFKDDVDMLVQASDQIDTSQVEYIQSAIKFAFDTYAHRKSPRGDTNTGGRTSPDGESGGLGAIAASLASGSSSQKTWERSDDNEGYGDGAVSNPRPSDIEVDSLISSIKDLLPHLGDGYIEVCLEEFNWNPELVVSNILEEKLPAFLQNISKDLPRQVRVAEKEKEANVEILESRKNVFDNDEFDVFHNKNVDKTKMHIGKKEQRVDINDKSTVKAVKATYEAYGNMDKESMYENHPMYEDEYDDTYDTQNVGAGDADDADELNNEKFLPRVLQDLQKQKTKGERIEVYNSSDSDSESNMRTRDEFVADPAKLREQAAMRKQSYNNRQAARGGPPAKPRDVVGAAKGQGQSKDVQRNRKMKEKHKGHRGQTDKKMSKGMF